MPNTPSSPSITPTDTTTTASAASPKTSRPLTPKTLHGNSTRYDYSKFRGLVILVEYNDLAFSRTDIKEIYEGMLNDKGYTGFMSNALLPEKIPYTGSVRDYYYENSNGLFDPTFDVVGPVKIDYASTYAKQTSYAQTLMSAAVKAADDEVDFSQYDCDGDGTVDMVFFLFSGGGSNYTGNDSNLLWPHASTLTTRVDGVSLGRYACSVELYGRPANKIIDGIGTIVHEFGHVLGLPDLYDTDYASSGGTSIHPQKWSVMASGSYLNQSRTPAGYSLYERYALGFATPQQVTETGDYTLDYIGTANTGLRIDTDTKNEYYLFENRQKQRWDAYLPGEGMLVFRVDSTSVTAWDNNDVNVNPAHNYYELLRATPKTTSSGVTDSDGDPFPGSGNVTELNYNTSPALLSWSGDPVFYSLSDIAMADGKVTLHITRETPTTATEDFESMPLTSGDAQELEGKFTTWTLASGASIVASNDTTGTLGYGAQLLGLVRSATAATGVIDRTVTSISFDVCVADDYGSSTGSIYCQYDEYGSDDWSSLASTEGKSVTVVAAGDTLQLSYKVPSLKGASYRLLLKTGNRTKPVCIDNFRLQFDPNESVANALTTVRSDAPFDVRIADGRIELVTTAESSAGQTAQLYNAVGQLAASATISAGRATFAPAQRGLYIITCGGTSRKIIF
jgi:M6 family metalloprotease-like protein